MILKISIFKYKYNVIYKIYLLNNYYYNIIHKNFQIKINELYFEGNILL